MKNHFTQNFLLSIGTVILLAAAPLRGEDAPVQISGRYPHLAMFNTSGECGTGAVVPWANRLWVVTYSPHEPRGSDDKLYEITPDLIRTIRPESVGGTPADRMIHRESNQLIIGPYFIDADARVRAIPPAIMPGRLTAAARSLTDDANQIYLYDMEGALYSVDVHTLAVQKLFARAAQGHHGKGAYTAQGRLVIANNGNVAVNKAVPAAMSPGYATDPESSGCLAQWDGKSWSVVMPREFTEVTGPGGIDGSPNPNSPLWSIGWDKRSVILELLDGGQWHTFRLPIGDQSYMASHGWYTEWPRIRDVGDGHLLMNMHGQWFDFPRTFSAGNTAGLRAIGDYLKITGDFAPFNGQIVFGCDDASIMQNPLDGLSQSNLWFSSWDKLKDAGPASGEGGPWSGDAVQANVASVPYLFAGYERRTLHLSHESDLPVTFKLETDDGTGKWTALGEPIVVPPRGYVSHVFDAADKGEWIRLTASTDAAGVRATFTYDSPPHDGDPRLFQSLCNMGESGNGGTIRPVKDKTLQYHTAAGTSLAFDADLKFHPMDDAAFPPYKSKVAVSSDDASIVVIQHGQTYRLPRSPHFVDLPDARTEREVVTERSLLNVGGTFYMLPRPDSGGMEKVKPIATHEKAISDFCSWRGLMVLAGTKRDATVDGHYFSAGADQPGLWFGDIDDLWKMGKPVGHGGPWLNSSVAANTPSDPYLMRGFDEKTLRVSHSNDKPVTFTIEIDPAADGTWHPFTQLQVQPGKTLVYGFPHGFSADWVRMKTDIACRATAQLDYK